MFAKQLITRMAVCICLLFTTASSAQTLYPFNKIVIFGDSLTDNGNLFLHDAGLLPKSPPYFNGRFSNGDIWADNLNQYFIEHAGIGVENYAFGGETVIFHDPVERFVPYNLRASVQAYLWNAFFQDKSDVLYIFWIGANDYLSGADDTDLLTSSVVNQLSATIEYLIAEGGKNFLVMNLPDMAATPYGRIQLKRENLAQLTREHNAKLAVEMEHLQSLHPQLILRTFDINQVFTRLMQNPEEFNQQFQLHITDTQTSCWSGGYTLKQLKENAQWDMDHLADKLSTLPDLSAAYLVGVSRTLGSLVCTNPNEHVFWDHLHPSSAVHEIISNVVIENINQIYQN